MLNKITAVDDCAGAFLGHDLCRSTPCAEGYHPDRGSEFVVSKASPMLPFYRRQCRKIKISANHMLEPTKYLLVVEDEVLISIMIEEMARELGWGIAGTARNPADAFQILNSCVPTLALLDIDLGHSGNSLDIARVCRDRNIPVIFTTGYSAADIPTECGDSPILKKPFSSDELAKSLQAGLTLTI